MLVVYLTIPFMLLAIAIAVVPLLWTMKRHQHLSGQLPIEVVHGNREAGRLVA
jgi:hypothetical protein